MVNLQSVEFSDTSCIGDSGMVVAEEGIVIMNDTYYECCFDTTHSLVAGSYYTGILPIQ